MKSISPRLNMEAITPAETYHPVESTDTAGERVSFKHTAPANGAHPDEFPEEEHFDYGYRYARKIGLDGKEHLITIPLTRDDVIHPQLGDVQLHNDPHQVFCNYFFSLFKSQLRSNPSAVVFHDTGVFWDDPTLRPNSPDVTVIVGVKEQKKWTSFDVAEEGVRPELVVEVTSPDTRSIDLVDKLQIYEQARVPFYIIVETDRKSGVEVVRLLGYQLAASGYEEMPLDERGWLWLETVQLFLGIQDGQAVCYDRSGKRMGSYAEVTEELEEKEETLAAEREALAAEREARALAEARIRELEAELRRRNGAS